MVLPIIIASILFYGGVQYFTSAKNPNFNPEKSHHRPDGFVNRYLQRSKNPGLLKWRWERFRAGLPKSPEKPILGIEPDLSFIQENTGQTAITWIGHSTILLQLDGVNLLTDPHFGNRASPVSFIGPKRHQAPGIPFEKLPRIDVVLISHNHYDHLDRETVQKLINRYPKILFFVPLGVEYWFKKNITGSVLKGETQNVFALDWDDTLTLKGKTADLTLHFLAVQHWSARSFWGRYETLWGSWAVLHPKFKFWFSGDLGYSKDTEDIGRKIGEIDLAAIAIGAYEPNWFMKPAHLNPKEAIQVMKDVKAKSAFGIHWGTFENLSDETLDQPPKDLIKAMVNTPVDFKILKHGETLRY